MKLGQSCTPWKYHKISQNSCSICIKILIDAKPQSVWLTIFTETLPVEIFPTWHQICHKGVLFAPFCLKLYQQVSHLVTYNFRIPKTYFFSPKQISLTPLETPLSLKKWIFKLLRLHCCWYSKLVPWDDDSSWKEISLIRSLNSEKTSKKCQNICIFDWFDYSWKWLTFSHILDVFSLLSDRIKLIPFHEQPASQDTHLEYHHPAADVYSR